MKITIANLPLIIVFYLSIQMNSAIAQNSHEEEIDIHSISWGVSQSRGQATHASLKNGIATIKFSDGKTEVMQDGTIKLKDGRTIVVKNGRIVQGEKGGVKSRSVGAAQQKTVGANQ